MVRGSGMRSPYWQRLSEFPPICAVGLFLERDDEIPLESPLAFVYLFQSWSGYLQGVL